MSEKSLSDQLTAEFGDAVRSGDPEAIDQWIEVDADRLVEVCEMLKDAEGIQLDMLNCITVVDYLHTDPKKAAKVDWEPHLEVVYHLSSTKTKQTLVLKGKVPRWKN